jgi:transcription-repair coupling factor (superfamily II helicase)
VEELKQGRIDIVVGTHRLLQKDIEFRDLGLVVIDEEQRFGVRHKERLKALRKTVDCLTMTATPIPRTLYMSLNGVRDMSMVNTPPENRLPIETYVVRFDRNVAESAILREMSRGGQVYLLHNRVNSIGAMAKFVKELVPEARVAIGHGQMEKHELERIMLDFIDGKYDVLVSTTIIESGIDIPNVNTIIINRADTFGLAELYQLRGRVGRERHQAYCYLLIPGEAGITGKAKRRLLAIQEFNQLGCGFQLALRDLEIRGMGNILGRQQHGHIAAIGFDLYNKMLSDTIKRLQGKGKEPEVVTSLDMVGRGGIDPEFVPSANSRMNLHKRLAQARELEEADAIEEELRDMFGPPPERARRFLNSVRLRIRASRAGFEKVSIGRETAELVYAPVFIRRGFSAEKIIMFNNRWGLTFRVNIEEEKIVLKVSNLGSEEDFPERLGTFLEKAAAEAGIEEEVAVAR